MKQFCSSTITDEKIGDILGLKVKFKNDNTGRIKTGKISDISSGAAVIVDRKYVSQWVAWHDIYDIR